MTTALKYFSDAIPGLKAVSKTSKLVPLKLATPGVELKMDRPNSRATVQIEGPDQM